MKIHSPWIQLKCKTPLDAEKRVGDRVRLVRRRRGHSLEKRENKQCIRKAMSNKTWDRQSQ